MMSLGEVGTEELLRPYRGVVSYHADAVQHLKSGNSVALQIEVYVRHASTVVRWLVV